MPIRYSLHPVAALRAHIRRHAGYVVAVVVLAASLLLLMTAVEEDRKEACRGALAFGSTAADIDKEACRAVYGVFGEGLY